VTTVAWFYEASPSPAFSAFNMSAAPAPTPGRGSAGDTRGKAVPGAYPYTLDRGRHTPVGVGQKAPSPVSTFNMPASSTPGRGSAGDTRGKAVPGAYPYTLDRGRHTPVGVGQKTPSPVSTFNMSVSPAPGRGSAGDTRGVSLYPGPWEAYSCGGGAKNPLPRLYFQYAGIPPLPGKG
jgi:hypothetical protein